MIEYNENDYNLERVDAINFKMNSFKMENKYWVFGLKQSNRPPVRIGVNDQGVPNEDQQKALVQFFKNQGVEVVIDNPEEAEVTIGLRYDVRERPKMAAAIVRTIVFFLEGKLRLSNDFKVSIPLKGKKKGKK